jgi:hypothetical protein
MAQERLPEGTQTHFRSIVTDQYLRVLGSNGSIFAIGDAATIQQVCTAACVGVIKKGFTTLDPLNSPRKPTQVLSSNGSILRAGCCRRRR